MLKIYLIYTGTVSIISMILFGIDKLKSKNENNSRIPESLLLGFASFGGALGAVLGSRIFHHKTVFKTKFHFHIGMTLSLLLQIGLGILIYLNFGGLK